MDAILKAEGGFLLQFLDSNDLIPKKITAGETDSSTRIIIKSLY